MIKKISFYLAIIIAFVFPTAAFATVPGSLNVFTTHGNFEVMVNAFTKLALIMSDAKYQGLLLGTVLAVCVGMFTATVGRAFIGGKVENEAWVKWILCAVVGIIIWQAFVQPTTNMIIYDKYSNRTMTVGAVPDGVVLIAGLINHFEEEIVEIVDTSSLYGFSSEQGAMTFKFIDKAFSSAVDLHLSNEWLNGNLTEYVKTCAVFEMGRPGTTLLPSKIHQNMDNVALLADAANPNIFVTQYNAANPGGTLTTCLNAWTTLNSQLVGIISGSTADKLFWKEVAASAGVTDVIGAVGPTMDTVSGEKTADMLSTFLASSVGSADMIKQYLIAKELDKALKSGDADAAVTMQGNRTKAVELISGGILANEWTPHLKAMMFASFLALLPFLLLLAATPLFGRSLTFILGMFVFFMAWAICSAILSQLAMEAGQAYFQELTSRQMGLGSMLMMSSTAAKAYASFGNYEALAFTLAGTLSTVFIKVSNTGITRFGQSTLSSMGGTGSTAGATTEYGSPIARASMQDGLTNAMSSGAMHNMHSFDNLAEASTFQRETSQQTAEGTIAKLGGDMMKAAGESAGANVNTKESSVARNHATENTAQEMGMSTGGVLYQNAYQQMSGQSGEGEAFHMKQMETGQTGTQITTPISTNSLNRNIGTAQGQQDAYADAQKHGFTGSQSEWFGDMEKIGKTNEFTQKQAMQQVAQDHFGGDLHNARAAVNSYQENFSAGAASMGPTDAKAYDLGRSGMTTALGNLGTAQTVGLNSVISAAQGAGDSKVAQNAGQLALNSIARNGSQDSNSAQDLKNLQGTSTGQAATQNMPFSFSTSNEHEAINMAKLMNKNNTGPEILASDILSGQTSGTLNTDSNGNISVGTARTQGGKTVGIANTRDEKAGNHKEATLTSEQANKMFGKTDLPGGVYKADLASNGSIQKVTGSNGFSVDTNNLTTSQQGAVSKTFDNVETIESGSQIASAQTAMNMLTKNEAGGYVVNPETRNNPALLEQRINTLATQLGAGLNSMVNMKEEDIDSRAWNVGAGADGGVRSAGPVRVGADGHAGVELQTRAQDTESINAHSTAVRNVINEVLPEWKSGNISNGEAAQRINSGLKDYETYAKEKMNHLDGKTERAKSNEGKKEERQHEKDFEAMRAHTTGKHSNNQ